MSAPIVVHSFEELASVLTEDDLAPASAEPVEYNALVTDQELQADEEVADALARLQEVMATLAMTAQQDDEAKALDLCQLEHYDTLVGKQQKAEHALDLARQARISAQRLLQAAYREETRDIARQLLSAARREESRLAGLVEERRAEAQALAATLDFDRLLAERRQQEELDKVRVAEAERARRLSDGLDRVRAALDSDRLEEARAMLGRLDRDYPNSAVIASLRDSMAERQLAVKAQLAEEAVEAAYAEYTEDPGAAVARLEQLDMDGLPPELAARLFGAWAKVCSFLCQQRDLLQPLRFAPYPGRGVVLAREQPEAAYIVVSNLGMSERLKPGSVANDVVVGRARPLR